MDGIIKTCSNNCCEFQDTTHCSVKNTKVKPLNIFFSFHVRREEQLRGSPMRSNITFLISGDLILLLSLSRFPTGRHRSKKENYSTAFFEFTYTTSACHPLLTHSHSLSFFSAHFLVPLLASAMPRIARYTALIIESILCRQ